MKKVSTVAANESGHFSQPKLTIGLDLGDRSNSYCVLDERGELQGERKVSTTAKAMREAFHGMPRSRIALETGTHSPWVSWDCSPGEETPGRASRRCTSARKAIPTCAPCWCKARSTSWDPSAPTATCAAGA